MAMESVQYRVSIPGLVTDNNVQATNIQAALGLAIAEAFANSNSLVWNKKRYEGEVGRDALLQDLLASPNLQELVQQLPGSPSQPLEIQLPQDGVGGTAAIDIDSLVIEGSKSVKSLNEIDSFVKDATLKYGLDNDAIDELNMAIQANFKRVSFVEHKKGHHNSKGELAEWCVVSHETGKILSSHKSESEAKVHLRDMEIHKGAKAYSGWLVK